MTLRTRERLKKYVPKLITFVDRHRDAVPGLALSTLTLNHDRPLLLLPSLRALGQGCNLKLIGKIDPENKKQPVTAAIIQPLELQ
eukprot:scaffold3987_cov134-Cylindrotheca_fusiformis.AAC.17